MTKAATRRVRTLSLLDNALLISSLVIKQCALERDLSLFEAGDETEVGERGITLSGGQKVMFGGDVDRKAVKLIQPRLASHLRALYIPQQRFSYWMM